MKTEIYHKRQAKDIVDALFDKGLLHPELTRKTMDALENYLGYILQSTSETAKKCTELTMKIKYRDES